MDGNNSGKLKICNNSELCKQIYRLIDTIIRNLKYLQHLLQYVGADYPIEFNCININPASTNCQNYDYQTVSTTASSLSASS